MPRGVSRMLQRCSTTSTRQRKPLERLDPCTKLSPRFHRLAGARLWGSGCTKPEVSLGLGSRTQSRVPDRGHNHAFACFSVNSARAH